LGHGQKANWLQKATAQSPWTTNDMATARNTGTTGFIVFINFAHCVKVHNNICLVYIKFNAFSYWLQLDILGGLSLYLVWCTFSAQLRPY
jgi:hypothetical protein